MLQHLECSALLVRRVGKTAKSECELGHVYLSARGQLGSN